MTAAILASKGGHEGCLRLLIAAGANLEHQNKVRDCECGVLSMVREWFLNCGLSKKKGAGGGGVQRLD